MSDASSVAAAAETATISQRLAYVGPTRALLGIFFRNLLFIVLTLGVYRFWARTRTRRFLWSSVRINDEPLDYAGTGRELFFGFLKAVAILSPVFLALELIEFALGPENRFAVQALNLVRFLGLLYLIFAGSYFARQYRASRTASRGIRFRQSGSAWRYAAMRLGRLVLVILTFGIHYPYYQMALARYETANLYYGSARFAFSGRGHDLFIQFLKGIALAIVIALVFGILAGIAFAALSWLLTIQPRILLIRFSIFLSIIFWICFWLGLSWYKAYAQRYVAERTRLEGLAFAMPEMTGRKLMGLTIGNWFITILSLALLSPLATQRTMRFWCRHLRLLGELDVAQVRQSEVGPAYSEGLAGFFAFNLG